MVDYFVTNVWLVKKSKNEDGVQNGDSGSNKRKHQKDIKDKEGK